MATWDKADCLSKFNSFAQRPSSDEISDATKYQWLSMAQQEVYHELATHVPHVLYGAPTALTTSDSKTFTFASSITPIGHVEIYPNLQSIPDSPLIEGVDFLWEGGRLRIPNDRTWASSATLYARYVDTPADITASVDPVLTPSPARELIVFKGVQLFAPTVGDDALESRMAQRYALALAKWLLVFKTQVFTLGSGSRRDPNGWYLGNPDLG